ncbi:ATP-dependent DNA helicase pif1 [Biomphalaria glabrata]|nr:ATP-dependent DNA helicase pif1 [Biomphalaria glabrata]
MLLHVVKGPTSFTNLKTVEGVVCQTFRETCQRRGMLDNDEHWEVALAEAAQTGTAQRRGGIVFLDAPGGTGKTFFLLKSSNKTILHLQWLHLVLQLHSFKGDRTAHSTLKLPLNLAHGVCDISKNSGQAKILQICSLIVWDECTMSHKRAIEAIDMLMQDLKNSKALMGGVVVMLAGDFRQTLPVIPKSTPADELNACLTASYLWKYVEKITLKTNMSSTS